MNHTPTGNKPGDLMSFVLIVGNARSGSTLLGAAIDAHSSAVVSNETPGSWNLWKKMSREQILACIYENAARMADSCRTSEGNHYQIGTAPATKHEVLVVGDKTWNPAVLLMHGSAKLLPDLQARLGLPVKIIEAIRNPFDVIASMHQRSGLPVRDRIRWYFMHCDATAALGERLSPESFTTSHHADLLADPAEELCRLCNFLGLSRCDEHIEAVRKQLLPAPRKTSANIAWDPADVEEIRRRMVHYNTLTRYADETPGMES